MDTTDTTLNNQDGHINIEYACASSKVQFAEEIRYLVAFHPKVNESKLGCLELPNQICA
ncbi:hypothetical protein FACS189418_6150 [Clostridia bacterium]|nr:hypothetical protein FACS189418_6150 [Clostridia bacterium]